MKLKKAFFIFAFLGLAFGLGSWALAVTKLIGQTATVTATCTDAQENLTQCKVTSPCTNTCAASGGSATCSCSFTCSSTGTFSACGQGVDTHGSVATNCPTAAQVECAGGSTSSGGVVNLCGRPISPSGNLTGASNCGSGSNKCEAFKSGSTGWGECAPPIGTNQYLVKFCSEDDYVRDGNDSNYKYRCNGANIPSGGIVWHGNYLATYDYENYGGVNRCKIQIDIWLPGRSYPALPDDFVVWRNDANCRQTLNAAKTGNGTGSVTSNPSGINCGSTCSSTFSQGTSVNLTPSPAAGSYFSGWSGDCSGQGNCTVNMNQARNVTASFTISDQTLNATKAGTGTGTVSSSPSGINCGPNCSHSYAYNTIVTLSASASTGSAFSGWSGDCTGTGNCVLTMTSNRSAQALFNDGTPPVSIITSPAALSTQNANFVVSTSDTDVGAGIDPTKCFYNILDTTTGIYTQWQKTRVCNSASSFSVSVGAGQDCRTSGSTCQVTVYSRDLALNESAWYLRTYNINWNSPPQAVIACDSSGAGCQPGSSGCSAFQACGFILKNDSTDPQGVGDITSSVWEIRDSSNILKNSLNCANNCSYTVPSLIGPGNYTAKLRVADTYSASSETQKNFTVKQDIAADFVCSTDNTNWQACDSPSFRPPQGSLIYLHDNLSDALLNSLGLSGRKSTPSQTATITSRTWKKDGVIFNSGNNSNVSITIDDVRQISLSLQDSVGRTTSSQEQVTPSLPSPDWEEISPY